MRHLFICLTLTLSLISCEQLTGASTGANDSAEIGKTRGGLLQQDGTLQGSGSIIFQKNLGPVKGAKSFEIIFELEPDGSLEIQTYTNENLEKGVGLKVQRVGDQLEVTVKGGGHEQVFYRPFENIDPSERIHWMIDSHNDHDDANHLLIWEYRENGGYTTSNALLNSDFFKLPLDLDGLEFYEWHDYGVVGQGAFWGLILEDSRVFEYETGRALNQS